jgi:NADPH-dependent glutamate synthase beta subunit-like oxidoreductase
MPPSWVACREVWIFSTPLRSPAPAHDVELEEAQAEGIRVRWLSTVVHADDGRLMIEKMRLDEDGFPQPTGELEELEVESLILAVGQDTDLSLVQNVPGISVEDGVVEVGGDLMTGRPGIFAGGDAVPGERSVTTAVGYGKRAARRIDRWLTGEEWQPDSEWPSAHAGPSRWCPKRFECSRLGGSRGRSPPLAVLDDPSRGRSV